MKAKSIFVGIIAALCIGSITYSAINQKETKPLSAEAYNDKTSVQNGLFVKVTDVNSIQNGEDLLLVGDDLNTFQHHIGVSYHYWLTTEFGGATRTLDNRNAIVCDNSKGELVTLERDSGNVFYLKLKHYVDNAFNRGKVKSGYIVQEAYNNNGVTAFGDLFIRDKKDKPSKAAATWELNYNQSGSMQITSKLNNRPLFWKVGSNYNWSSFACSTNTSLTSNINLYRKVSQADMIMSPNITELEKTSYAPGEEINLRGLKVQAIYHSGQADSITINSSFNSDSELFKPSFISYVYKAVHFTWCGLECAFQVEIEHDRSDEHLYLKPDEKIKDLRGTYLLGFKYPDPTLENQDVACVLRKATLISSDYGSDVGFERVSIYQNPICDTFYHSIDPGKDTKYSVVVDNLVEVIVSKLQGVDEYGYHIRVRDGQALYVDESNNQSTFGKLKLGEDRHTLANDILVDANNYITIGNFGRYIVFDKTNKVIVTAPSITDNYIPLALYKLQMTENLRYYDEELNAFKTTFISRTSAYDASAATKYVDYTDWDFLEKEFNKLSSDSQSYLASLTYVHNQEKANSFEQLADRYDSIVNTYYNVENGGYDEYAQQETYGFKDFMRRSLATTLQSKRNVNFVCQNCVINPTGSARAEYKSEFGATLVPDTHYKCPVSIEIKMGNKTLQEGVDYEYSFETGAISINQNIVVDDVTITANAELIQYTVAFVGRTSTGEEMVCYVYAADSYTLPGYEQIGFDSAPAGKQFKCWSVNGVQKNPGVAITVDENIEIIAVYESINTTARTIENSGKTTPYLSYNYEKNGDDYTFSNVTIRFRSIVSKALWDQLNGNSNNIRGYGVLFTTEDFISGADLKNYIYEVEGPDGQKTHGVDGVNIKDYRSQNVTPTLLSVAQYGDYVNEDSYSWNLKISFPDSGVKLVTRYVAVAYIDTVDSGIVFVSQTVTSVKDMAKDLLATDEYDEDSFGGSLDYLSKYVVPEE